ncbi:hypothetical protein R5W23_003897 [Gemmata sp. JC673]|uniref:WD40 repeat domain-containing protein n=1 Tax=Gemmata algarum TaxID=2975278 RepID=A0ABU5F4D8_9BACT|nr:hypothetical protein [Gemmata algarum]MDY3562431.1 hypothetical protein [Gemmata algarum]
MSRHFPRFAAARLSLAPALTGPAADEDRYGDPLPRGATGRLGTVRLRSNSYAAPVPSSDAKTLYLASSLGRFRLLDPATGATVGTLQEQPPGTFVAFSADGKRGLQATHDAVIVWDAGSGNVLAKVTARAHSRECSAALSADGSVLAIGGAQLDWCRFSARSRGRCERGEQSLSHARRELIESRVRSGLWQKCFDPEPPADRHPRIGERSDGFADPFHAPGSFRPGPCVEQGRHHGVQPEQRVPACGAGAARNTVFSRHHGGLQAQLRAPLLGRGLDVPTTAVVADHGRRP